MYADMLATMTQRTRYQVVEMIWDLAHAEVAQRWANRPAVHQ